MASNPEVDVPECTGGCGLPWASAEDHLRCIRQTTSMRLPAPEFLCVACWQKQVADAVEPTN